jgi:hypothetical protein
MTPKEAAQSVLARVQVARRLGFRGGISLTEEEGIMLEPLLATMAEEPDRTIVQCEICGNAQPRYFGKLCGECAEDILIGRSPSRPRN